MNFLAHIYLSGNHEKMLVGNFMGDYVKGRDYMKYPEDISNGIMLHRQIDFYTDCHPLVKQSKRRVEGQYRKYAGIIIDIFYDYFLCLNWLDYSSIPLSDFIEEVHNLLRKHYEVFPQGIRNWFPNFIRNNWLQSYSTIEGIESVLHRMSSRTSLPEFTDYAIDVLRKEEDELNREFTLFFADIRAFVGEKYGIKTGCPFEAA